MPTLSVGVLRCYAAVFSGAGFSARTRSVVTSYLPDMLVKEGDMRSLRVQQVSTSRGMITDRSGRPLAVSVPVKAIWADPKKCMTLAVSASVTAGRRWLTRSIFRWISSQPALTPTRKGALFIWRVR